MIPQTSIDWVGGLWCVGKMCVLSVCRQAHTLTMLLLLFWSQCHYFFVVRVCTSLKANLCGPQHWLTHSKCWSQLCQLWLPMEAMKRANTQTRSKEALGVVTLWPYRVLCLVLIYYIPLQLSSTFDSFFLFFFLSGPNLFILHSLIGFESVCGHWVTLSQVIRLALTLSFLSSLTWT